MSTPTPAQQWKKSSDADQAPHPLTLPSGNTALVKRPGIQAFLVSGVIPNELLAIVQGMMKKAQAGKAGKDDADAFVQELLVEPEKLRAAFDLADSVVLDVVVEPTVARLPALGEPRDPNVVYVEEVDIEDKMFILQYAMGGSSDLERFRQEQDSHVGSLSSVPGVALSPEQPARPPA